MKAGVDISECPVVSSRVLLLPIYLLVILALMVYVFSRLIRIKPEMKTENGD